MPSPAVELALKHLYEKHGRLDPHDVVQAAKHPKSPLHDRFEWDNTVAAEQWRLQQARMLIRSVEIERITVPGEPPRVIRMYVHDPDNNGYVASTDVVKQVSLRDRILDDMRADLERLKQKWKLYEETFAAIAAEVLVAEVAEESDKVSS